MSMSATNKINSFLCLLHAPRYCAGTIDFSTEDKVRLYLSANNLFFQPFKFKKICLKMDIFILSWPSEPRFKVCGGSHSI